jgi:hypothetical protein
MHRPHESLPPGITPGDDLAGHVLEQEPWEVVRPPALADEAETYRVETVLGQNPLAERGARPCTRPRALAHIIQFV